MSPDTPPASDEPPADTADAALETAGTPDALDTPSDAVDADATVVPPAAPASSADAAAPMADTADTAAEDVTDDAGDGSAVAASSDDVSEPDVDASTAPELAGPVVIPELSDAQRAAIEGFRPALAAANPRQTKALNALLQQMRDLALAIGWPKSVPPTGAFAELKALLTEGNQLLEQNRVYQQQLFDETRPLVDSLRQAMEAGQSADALQAWDRIQGKLTHLGGKLAKALNKDITEFRTPIKQLKDWKLFASAEKKKALIEQMRTLAEQQPNLGERARQINAMHSDWKALGRSTDNETLWTEFKQLSDAAYEPCKAHFKQQKQVLAENFRQRTQICEQLEAWLAVCDRAAPNLSEMGRIEKQAKEDWKRFAPVEQSKIKPLQKRFYGIMDQFRDLRRGATHGNLERKQALVTRAQELAGQDNPQAAMAEARTLQAQWKEIGPVSFKEDRQLWETFRAACDAIFAKRDTQRREQGAQVSQVVAACHRLIGELEALAELPDDALRDAQNRFRAVQREFRDALDSRVKKERKTLQDHFHDAVRKVDARFKRLPDKRTLQLQQALSQRSDFCADLERRAASASDDASLRAVLDSVDRSAWDALPTSGNGDLDKVLRQRLDAVLALQNLTSWQVLLAERERQVRTLCVEAEIRSGVDSPSEDQALRMQLQLAQLQSGFGRLQLTTEEALVRNRDALLQWQCLGPLPEALREITRLRLQTAISKLA